jgi:carbon storage regulator
MLIMSRRQGETILIGDDIEIVIAHIGRSRVKVGIRAPRQLVVVAQEVKLVGEENHAAAQVPSPAVLEAILSHLLPESGQTPCGDYGAEILEISGIANGTDEDRRQALRSQNE